MERRLQNSRALQRGEFAGSLLLGSLRPAQSPGPHLASPGLDDASGAIATGAVDADPAASVPSRHRSLRRHGMSMPYFSFSSSIGG